MSMMLQFETWIGILILAWVVGYLYVVGIIRSPLSRMKKSARSGERVAWAEYAYIPEATIAHNVGPRFEEFMKSQAPHKCEMLIVGNDGHVLEDQEYPWGDYLQAWSSDQHKCTINLYLTMDTDKAVRTRMDEIVQKSRGRFHYHVLAQPAECSDPVDRKLIEALEVFHPSLCWNTQTGAGVMWIEYYHPPASKRAYDCYFFPPDLAKEHGFDFYKQTIERAGTLPVSQEAS